MTWTNFGGDLVTSKEQSEKRIRAGPWTPSGGLGAFWGLWPTSQKTTKAIELTRTKSLGVPFYCSVTRHISLPLLSCVRSLSVKFLLNVPRSNLPRTLGSRRGKTQAPKLPRPGSGNRRL